jgi:hypothetical protein
MGMATIPYDKAGAAKLRKAKPSELILIALDDLAKVERQKRRFRVDMCFFFMPKSVRDGKCVVCLAGGVMAGTLAIPPDIDASPWGGDIGPSDVNGPSITKILDALDAARSGSPWRYLRQLGRKVPKALEGNYWGDPHRLNIPGYANDRPGFKSGLRKMANLLAEHGL